MGLEISRASARRDPSVLRRSHTRPCVFDSILTPSNAVHGSLPQVKLLKVGDSFFSSAEALRTSVQRVILSQRSLVNDSRAVGGKQRTCVSPERLCCCAFGGMNERPRQEGQQGRAW